MGDATIELDQGLSMSPSSGLVISAPAEGRVDAVVEPLPPAAIDPALDELRCQSCGKDLAPGDHTLLELSKIVK